MRDDCTCSSWGADPGLLDRGFKFAIKGVRFDQFTHFFSKFPHQNEIIWTQKGVSEPPSTMTPLWICHCSLGYFYKRHKTRTPQKLTKAVMSHDMTKPTKWVCTLQRLRSMSSLGPKLTLCGQRRLWSDWADAQADLSSLGAHSFWWFCHVAALII